LDENRWLLSRRLGPTLVSLGLILTLVAASSANATVTASFENGRLTVSSDADDAIDVTCEGGQTKVNGQDPGSPVPCSSVQWIDVTGGPGGNAIDLSAVSAVDFTLLYWTHVDGLGGADDITGSSSNLPEERLDGGADDDVLSGGGGTDIVLGGANNDVLNGGAGDDQVSGGFGNDVLNGDSGDDWLLGWTGDDIFHGGDGIDVADYALANYHTEITIDGLPGDGELAHDGNPHENDNVGLDVENVSGGFWNDYIVGSSAVNFLSGGNDGADELLGGPGPDLLDGGLGFPEFGEDILRGEDGDDSLLARVGRSSFFGGSGADTVDYSAQLSDVSITLDDVRNDGLNGLDNVHTDVETVLSGSGNDSLAGDADANVLVGGGGNDVLDGGLGSDELQGGSGTDRVSYATRTGGVVADLEGDGDDGEPGELDAIASDVEGLVGGSGADVLTGSPGDNFLSGGGGSDLLPGGAGADELVGASGNDELDGDLGDDRLDGGLGADHLAGGTGLDELSYADRTNSVYVDLLVGEGNGEPGENDSTSGIEQVVGGAGDDVLLGDPGDDALEGGAGRDLLDGREGADRLAGGDGFDLADYSPRAAPVEVDLDGEVGDDGEIDEGDTVLADVEDLAGGSGADTLIGNGSENIIDGGQGADVISGLGAFDLADYSQRVNRVIADLDGLSGDDGEAGEGDTLSADIEGIAGGSGSDVLGGGDGDNFLAGGAGLDQMTGGTGFDFLMGDSGDDTIDSLDDEEDVVVCGSEIDTAIADAFDDVDVDCEYVSNGTPPPPPPPPPPAPPPPPPPPAPLPPPPPPSRPVQCRVPKLIGLRLATARVRIRRAHCSVGRVSRRRSSRVGRVLRQSPRPGSIRRRGARINLVVGKR
jgi:Ca2+-binding RTX toxin-like protein